MRAYLESVKYFYLWFLFQPLCLLGNFALFLSSADFISKSTFFPKLSPRISSECQTVWIQIRYNVLPALKWIQTVCRGYQETTLAGRFVVNHQMTQCISKILDIVILNFTVITPPPLLNFTTVVVCMYI